MSSLREIDHDLDQIPVDAALLAEVQKGVAARGTISLASADEELAALGKGSAPRPKAVEDDAPPSGQIDVPDHVLRSSELPAVLAIDAEPPTPLALDLDADLAGADLPSGATALDEPEELAPVKTSASVVPVAPPTEKQALEGDDPEADLASLLGDSDPMREDAAELPPPADLEPEATMMFSAEDAERFSRPPSALEESSPVEEESVGDLELEVDEIIEIDDMPEAEPEATARPRTAPPPPPRTAPPPPPGARPSEAPQGRGFLGKLLQRKP